MNYTIVVDVVDFDVEVVDFVVVVVVLLVVVFKIVVEYDCSGLIISLGLKLFVAKKPTVTKIRASMINSIKPNSESICSP